MAQDIVLEGLGKTYLNVPAVTLPKSSGGTALFVEFTELANAGDQTPLSDGIAAVGTSSSYAREDHVHPSDDSKVDKVANKGLSENDFTTVLKEKLDSISDGAEVNVQPDWLEANQSSDAFIRNKPPNLVQDASYVHTDNNYTSDEKSKLSGIESNAEANVQVDWNESDTTSDAYIQNKPNLGNIVSFSVEEVSS